MRHASPATLAVILCLLAASPAGAAPATPCPSDDDGPRGAVMGYLTAMHEHRFVDAYDFVTDGMTDGRDRTVWAVLQGRAYGPGKVEIYGVDPRAAMVDGDDTSCTHHAVVPNLLSARDRLNIHGAVEFELYHVVREDGRWRVDSQETLFDDPAILHWFPGTEIVEVDAP
ncbi:MAG: hypothetical protein KDK06_06490 [Gammaproteobacteria bacterium]|nr:hypothetical protein [Gammaproteobacteria bacterium]